MLICDVHKQQRQQQTNKKEIQDYLGGSCVHKSTCSRTPGLKSRPPQNFADWKISLNLCFLLRFE